MSHNGCSTYGFVKRHLHKDHVAHRHRHEAGLRLRSTE